MQSDLHSALALSEVCRLAMLGQHEDSLRAVQHLSQSFRLLNANIGSAKVVNDLTLATVVYISLSERMRGHYTEGQIHVQALKRMVTMRGGMQELLKNSHLAQKVFM